MYNKFLKVPFALYLVACIWTYNVLRTSFVRFVPSTTREFPLIPSTLHLFRTRGETLFHRLSRDASVSDISWNFWNFSTNDICIFANNSSKQNARTSSMQERSFPTNFLEMRVNQSNPSRIIWTIFAISLDEAVARRSFRKRNKTRTSERLAWSSIRGSWNTEKRIAGVGRGEQIFAKPRSFSGNRT